MTLNKLTGQCEVQIRSIVMMSLFLEYVAKILRVHARFKDDVNDSESDLKMVPFYTIVKCVSLKVQLKVE